MRNSPSPTASVPEDPVAGPSNFVEPEHEGHTSFPSYFEEQEPSRYLPGGLNWERKDVDEDEDESFQLPQSLRNTLTEEAEEEDVVNQLVGTPSPKPSVLDQPPVQGFKFGSLAAALKNATSGWRNTKPESTSTSTSTEDSTNQLSPVDYNEGSIPLVDTNDGSTFLVEPTVKVEETGQLVLLGSKPLLPKSEPQEVPLPASKTPSVKEEQSSPPAVPGTPLKFEPKEEGKVDENKPVHTEPLPSASNTKTDDSNETVKNKQLQLDNERARRAFAEFLDTLKASAKKKEAKMSPLPPPPAPPAVNPLDPTAGDLTTLFCGDMPLPDGKERIGLSVEDANEILRYLEVLEAYFQKAGTSMTEGRLRKYYAVLYLRDYHLKEKWKALPQYQTGTWDEFKKAVCGLYPGIASKVKGSLAELNDICRLAGENGLGLGDYERLRRMISSFEVYGNKLVESSKPLLTTAQFSQKFAKCLSPEFRYELKRRLPMYRKDITLAQLELEPVIKPLWEAVPWKTVLAVADLIGQENREDGEFDWDDRPTSHRSTARAAPPHIPAAPSAKEEAKATILLNQVQGLVKKETDELRSVVKEEMQNIMSKMESTLSTLKNSAPTQFYQQSPVYAYEPQMQLMQSSRPFQSNYGQPRPPPVLGPCFYCKGNNHGYRNCYTREQHLREGKLVVKDSFLYAGNTDIRMPRFEDLAPSCPRDWIEEQWSKNHPKSVQYQTDFNEDYYLGPSSTSSAGSSREQTLAQQVAQLSHMVSQLQRQGSTTSPPITSPMAPPPIPMQQMLQGYPQAVNPGATYPGAPPQMAHPYQQFIAQAAPPPQPAPAAPVAPEGKTYSVADVAALLGSMGISAEGFP